jgi:tetratricopeptide (TPR) repeat protein
LNGPDVELAATARLRAAEVYLAIRQPAEAEKLLATAPEGPARALLRGRAAFAQGHSGEALRDIEPLASVASLPEPLRVSARNLQARIKAAAGQNAEAARALIEFVQQNPDSTQLSAVLLTLHDIGGFGIEGVEKLLVDWTGSQHLALANAASYALGVAHHERGRIEPAVAALNRHLAGDPDGATARESRLRLAQMALEKHDAPATLEEVARLKDEGTSPAWQSRSEFLAGLAESLAERFAEAAGHFEAAAALTPDPDAALAAHTNAAIAAIQTGSSDVDRWLRPLKSYPETHLRLLLERGLLEAAMNDADASSSLETFLAAAPANHPRAVEAHVALAELALDRSPPLFSAARQHSLAAGKVAAGPWVERIAWLTIWMDELDGRMGTAIDGGRAFLNRHPNSKWRPSVHLKLAELLGRVGDWTGAVNQYRALATEEDDDTELAARALYLAGIAESAIPSPDSLDRAIDFWRDAAKADEAMTFPARFRQAMAKARLGDTDEALKQLEGLLASKPPPSPAQRQAVLCARGELFLRPGEKSPPQPQAAAAAFDQVAQDPATPTALKYQALCRKADSLRRLGRADDALAVYTEAAQPVLGTFAEESPPVNELTWPLRAGFSAFSLCSERGDWKTALDLAIHLAQTPGPHAARAKDFANRIRLEHFLWED